MIVIYPKVTKLDDSFLFKIKDIRKGYRYISSLVIIFNKVSN